MDWGKSIILAFVVFAVFIAVLVTVCVRQDVSLVSPDYYNDELKYQAQLDRAHNTDELLKKPEIYLTEEQSLRVDFDFNELAEGKLVFYSPADVTEDKVFRLEPASSQTFALGMLKKGNYKVKMTWTAKGKEFYFEKSIFI